MHSTMTTRGATLAVIGVVVLVLFAAVVLAGSAQAAPRMGITVARSVPAEAVGATPSGATFLTRPLSSAAISSPLTTAEEYAVVPWAAAWVIGGLGAIALIGGASAFAQSRKRGRGGRPAELAGRAPEAIAGRSGEDERRKAA